MHRASDGSCRVQRGLAGRAGHAEAPGTAKCCPYAADGVESAVAKLQYSDAGQQTSPGRGDRQPVLPRSRAPTSLPPVSDDRHDGEMKSAETDETHGAFSFHDGLPSPRWRLVM